MTSNLKHVKKRLSAESPDARRAAVDAMRGLSKVCPEYVQVMGKLLQEDADDFQRVQILDIFGGAAANAQPYLLDIVKELEHPDWAVRRAAIECLQDLGEHATPTASQVARRLLHHDPDVKRAAAEALGRMGVHAGGYGHRIQGTLDTEEDPDVRRACEVALQLLEAAGDMDGTPPTSPVAVRRS
mmetsp:Transcript_117046/g.377713  ORF Transcript_117046/g.377713 Transcript_117046/m.377713 type:complete len:185 (-) Transcript_117046:171-725(-)